MDKRKRLIELIRKSDILCDTCGENSSSYCAEALADYLLANGIIVPPCKVGDTVWMHVGNDIREMRCVGYYVGEAVGDLRSGITLKLKDVNTGVMYAENVERAVYFDKEEAEQALKGDLEQ